ncbi:MULTISPECIES: hypothetical protein [unclassified Mesorhizobium]|uniref:hypothetical protein n=1 Tax=unclassified Mesorhizobium TaxID=325217 RepID=UPI000FCADBC2|nr:MULTISPECIES: hypothetical protein [unclassified Mesorhizobium]RUW69965.1 hypothetical protein EOA31_21595 [Mesorhizobium sp. M4B.F.Ca.ET.049.02.1.2]RVD30148.1 hypothetical protein EN738_07500 [Mesorhizobium sp. M4B.F.Ca.ET.017.02.2.1]RWA58960.1 MAG: hypothetical protein EOQ27_28080 [Mesorhizobium sp.]TGV18033.1 hypothetical protein EN786_35450 [Mesorhizobium sp. M4B.F.Ca.ET.143.01.1.1]TIX19442.1 MAG: hypothetical protein E5V41_01485 [Mesorhizobium sp.]
MRAQPAGNIQAGAAQDKTPGFDPAAVPQETDAEAAATRTSPNPTAKHTANFTNQASFANAMRPMDSEPGLRPGNNWPVLVIAAVVVLAAVVFVIAAMLSP